jgi:hypothetical protein
MTKTQLNTLIAALLDQSGKHCGSAAEQDIRFGSNTWIAHMSASMTLAGMAAGYMAVRDQMNAEERPYAPRETDS